MNPHCIKLELTFTQPPNAPARNTNYTKFKPFFFDALRLYISIPKRTLATELSSKLPPYGNISSELELFVGVLFELYRKA